MHLMETRRFESIWKKRLIFVGTASQLLVSGSTYFILWELTTIQPSKDSDDPRPILKYKELWKSEQPNPIALCIFAPVGNYFASLGENDPFVKVWYKYNKAGLRRFVYLAHQRAVLNMSWRVPR